MRMSCNGCRVLRKGCSESCVLRPCLHWISTAESQANAIVFLVKFYGRAGLTNLISNGPEHLRPAIFRSLLYDACGRMVNPIYGSLGLLRSGNWALCQAGVESILQGSFSTNTQGDFPSHIVPMKEMAVRKIYRSVKATQGDFPSHIVPMKEMAVRKIYRSVKARGRFKGFSVSKPRPKESDRASVNSDMDSGSKSDDCSDLTKASQKRTDSSEFNEKFIENSTFFSEKELDEFVATHEQQMEYFHDLCNVGSIQTEASACNAVGLELTLGSQCSTSHSAPRKQS